MRLRFPPLGLLVIVCVQPLLSAGSLLPIGLPRQEERAEWVVEGVPTAVNPFDPDEISVDVTIRAPSGETWVQPAFWFQDYARRKVGGEERVEPIGEPQWRLRIWPREAGLHQATLRIHLYNTSETRDELSFVIQPGQTGPGYIRRSTTQSGDLMTEDGALVRLHGANYCWPDAGGTFTYDRWFNQLRHAGGNFARLWLAPWWLGLEHRPGTLNRYPLAEAWKLDHLFAQAEGNGLNLLLCLDHHGMFQQSNQNWGGSNNFWPTNPYSVQAGGPCAAPNDFFTLEAARSLYQKRLRYLVARYSYSPRLVSWQFFNEIDNTFLQQVRGDDVLAWHQVMARWLRQHDPMRHLISTSMTGGSDQPAFWHLPEMDFSVYHSYQDPAPARKLAQLAADFVQRYQKPMLVGEFGVDARSWNSALDPHLRGFRQLLWGAVVGGAAGPAHSWWWESLESDQVYPVLHQVSELMTKAGWNSGHWRPARVTQDLVAPLELKPATQDAVRTSLLVQLNPGRRLPLRGSVALPHPLAAERASEYLSQFLYGTRNPQLPHTASLRVALGENARLLLRVNAVASDNQLIVRAGGRELYRTGFTNRDNLAQLNREIDQEISVDLPSGLQTLEIANVGEDWTGLESLRIDGALTTEFASGWRFETEAFALRNETRAVVYLVSPLAVYPAGAQRYQIEATRGASIRLPDWPKGRYAVTWYEPETGRQLSETTVEVPRDTLVLTAPEFRSDLLAMVSALP